ncbi:protein phosphatase 2C domain-containing protein [Nocardia brevicatena]|uniref:protein phosphatase 2C domain-containing protein n=1 Tax=Nocardia brevicatena TaxID=37327 RepID=UPI0002E25C74|nr:protein phosphatase 2C domain-containing protein [Nocardia brevicatena]
MEVATAQLDARSGDDRVLTTRNSVIVLDGASSFAPDMPTAGTFVDTLGQELRAQCETGTEDLTAALSRAIETTSSRLGLQPGAAPSSTVSIVRVGHTAIDVLALGDSPIIVGRTDGTFETIHDDRLDRLDLPEATRYRERLRAGSGYDDEHRAILGELQHQERKRRNRDGGYWIAEADHAAAQHSITARYARDDVAWVILATDGAAEPLAPLGISWSDVAQLDASGLAELLVRCEHWEAQTDPAGRQQPRAKRHDDKTVAVVRL